MVRPFGLVDDVAGRSGSPPDAPRRSRSAPPLVGASARPRASGLDEQRVACVAGAGSGLAVPEPGAAASPRSSAPASRCLATSTRARSCARRGARMSRGSRSSSRAGAAWRSPRRCFGEAIALSESRRGPLRRPRRPLAQLAAAAVGGEPDIDQAGITSRNCCALSSTRSRRMAGAGAAWAGFHRPRWSLPIAIRRRPRHGGDRVPGRRTSEARGTPRGCS